MRWSSKEVGVVEWFDITEENCLTCGLTVLNVALTVLYLALNVLYLALTVLYVSLTVFDMP